MSKNTMKRSIPDGDPVLDLTDEEHALLMGFLIAWNARIDPRLDQRDRDLPLEEGLAAAMICFLREPKPYLRDYTGAIIHWNRDVKNHYAECTRHDGIWCTTPLGTIRADLVAEYENGSSFRGHRQLTGVL